MRTARRFYVAPILMLVAIAIGLVSPGVAAAAQRGIRISTTYPSVTISKADSITLPIKLANQGEADERVDISLSSPQGWTASLVNEEFGSTFEVQSMFVPIKGDAPSLFLKTKPPTDVKPGSYAFNIKAVSQDKQVNASLDINVAVVEKPATVSKLTLNTPFPDIRGSVDDNSFQFNVDVTNDGSDDRTVSFAMESPKGWQVSFRPQYESTLIVNMGMKAGDKKTIQVTIQAPPDQEAKQYSFVMRATSGSIEAKLPLTVTLTKKEDVPTYQLRLSTPSGRLNADVVTGKESHASITVGNTGTADIKNVSFFADSPSGWKVAFDPAKIDKLAPNEVRQVDVAITSTAKTISGDYAITIRTSGDRGSDSMALRTAVGASTAWGWIGLFIVALVIASVVGLFWRVGRR